jgi:hypothetical protein
MLKIILSKKLDSLSRNLISRGCLKMLIPLLAGRNPEE